MIRFIHIDYGSKDTAGLYLAQILRVRNNNYTVEAYVQHDFPLVDVNADICRLFERYTSVFGHGIISKVYKLIDLYLCFSYIILQIRKKSRISETVVVVQFFQSFHAYKYLFKYIRKRCRLVVTVHDAVELKHSYPSWIMSDRDQILSYADTLIVHNKESERRLSYLNHPIEVIPFPLMSPTQTERKSLSLRHHQSDVIEFLFIGHVRAEKGLDVLIQAWKELPTHLLTRAHLTIAGSNDQGLEYGIDGLSQCTIKFGFLNDEEFNDHIVNCHYVVMPYSGGTNSGVLSVATAHGKPCITTDLPIFTESVFFEPDLCIKNDGLLGILSTTIERHNERYQSYLINISHREDLYNKLFDTAIVNLYKRLKPHGSEEII